MKVKRLLFLFSILFILPMFVNSVCADWVLVQKDGDWELEGREHYISGWDSDRCRLIYELNVVNFTAYSVDVNGKIKTDPVWVTIFWEEIFYVRSEVTEEEYAIDLLNWKDVGISFFGISWVGYGCEVWFWDGNNYRKLRASTGNVNWKVRMFRSAETKLTFQAEGYISEGKCSITAEKIVDVSPAFFENVTVGIIHIEKTDSLFGLNGKIEGYLSNEILLINCPPVNYTLQSEAEWQQTLADYLWQVLTGAFKPFEPVIAFFGDLWKYINYAFQFLGEMFSYATAFIPVLLSIFGVWIMIFTVTNLATSNLTPIVDLFVGIYQFFANLITMLVSVIEAIYNKLKFW